ncbi:MAG: hypothetical protein WCS42_08665 [Verrucomicrobiota bacterium]
MSRWTLSNPHPTKVNLFVRDGEWVARHGVTEVTAAMRVLHSAPNEPPACFDMGKFDAFEKLCRQFPGLWAAGYTVLEETP